MIDILEVGQSKNKKILKLIATISGSIVLTFSSVDGKAIGSQKGYGVDNINKTQYVNTDSSAELNKEDIVIGQNISFLKDRVKSFSFFDVKTISRAEFDSLHGDFLQKKGTGSLSGGDTISYTLYLPKILYIGDLPNIIKKINNNTFGDKLPDDASYIEIKRNIESAMIYILSLKNDKNKKQIQKEINKYYKLYQDFFPGENPNIDTTNSHNNIDRGTYYFKNNNLKETKNIKSRYPTIETSFLIKKIDGAIAENIYSHFLESFFEHGTQMLGNITLLKNNMNFNKMKYNLDKIRKIGNKNSITKQEILILNNIMSHIQGSNFINKNISKPLFNTSIPTEIIKTNEITCVGYSIIAHKFLSDLGIKYNVLYSQGHSLTNIELENGEKYLFDLLENKTLVKYKSLGMEGGWEKISYDIDGKNIETKIVKGLDPEKMIIAQILQNKENMILDDNEESLIKGLTILNIAKNISPEIPSIRASIAKTQYKLGNYNEALTAIVRALEISPKESIYRLRKSNIYLKLNDMDGYNDAKNMYRETSK